MKKFAMAFALIVALSSSSNIQAKEKVSIKPEMTLLNSYLKGIHAELKNAEPQTSELHALSELFLSEAYKIKKKKTNGTFHKDFKSVIDDVKLLYKASKKNNYMEALKQAKAVKNNCSKCHVQPN